MAVSSRERARRKQKQNAGDAIFVQKHFTGFFSSNFLDLKESSQL